MSAYPSKKKTVLLTAIVCLSLAVIATVSVLAWFFSSEQGKTGTVVVGKFSASLTVGGSATTEAAVTLKNATVLGDDAVFSENTQTIPISVINNGDIAFRLTLTVGEENAGSYLAYMLVNPEELSAAADRAAYLLGLLYAKGETVSDAETHTRIARHNAAFLSSQVLESGGVKNFAMVVWACGLKVKDQDPFAGGVHVSSAFALTVGIVQTEGGL